MLRRKALRTVLVAAMLLGAMTVAAVPYATTHAAKGHINVGTKNFGEEYVVSDMYKLLLEKAGYDVGKTHDLATTAVLQKALVRGDIDLYPEYTGTGLGVLGVTKAITNPAKAYQRVKNGYKKFKLTW